MHDFLRGLGLAAGVSMLAGCGVFGGAESAFVERSYEIVSDEDSTRALFGALPDGTQVHSFTLMNESGSRAVLIDYGATLTQLHVADRGGKFADVVLGFDDITGYLERSQYFGCTTGRVANRIDGGKFSLGGVDYTLACNDEGNGHHLHGGMKGIDKVMWSAEEVQAEDGRGVRFRYTSPDDEEGYPGALSMEVIYVLTDDDELRITYEATADQATPVNLTHHSYFNLTGAGQGTILDHELTLCCAHYTPAGPTLIPTGEIASVDGTNFDFTDGEVIGARIADVEGGYDLNYVIDREDDDSLAAAARLEDPASGRVMEILTSEPGIQFYTGNFLDGMVGKGGRTYPKHGACCLETQHYPDSINQPAFPSVVLAPGETYRHVIVHRFSTN